MTTIQFAYAYAISSLYVFYSQIVQRVLFQFTSDVFTMIDVKGLKGEDQGLI